MCLQTFHGVEKTPLFYYNNQHQEKRFGGSKKGIRFSKKFFETHRKPHGYWVPVISVTKDKNRQARQCLSIFIYLKNQSYATTFLLFRPKQALVDYRACGANLFKYLNLSAMGEFKFFLHDSYMILFRLFINSWGNEKRSRLRCCPASDPIRHN